MACMDQAAPSFRLQYRTRADYRSPVFLLPRIIDKLAMAFLMGTLFW